MNFLRVTILLLFVSSVSFGMVPLYGNKKGRRKSQIVPRMNPLSLRGRSPREKDVSSEDLSKNSATNIISDELAQLIVLQEKDKSQSNSFHNLVNRTANDGIIVSQVSFSTDSVIFHFTTKQSSSLYGKIRQLIRDSHQKKSRTSETEIGTFFHFKLDENVACFQKVNLTNNSPSEYVIHASIPSMELDKSMKKINEFIAQLCMEKDKHI